MTKWVFLTVLLYITLVFLLFVPVALWTMDIIAGEGNSLSEFFEMYGSWPFWLVYGIMVLIQALLLIFPVAKYKGRPKPQRAIWVPIITTAFLFSILLLGVVASIAAAIWGDNAFDGVSQAIFWILTFIGGSWALWALVFYRFARTNEGEGFVHRLMTWLIRGSIVELLVAIPCHIIVRHKDECCAQGLTFFGIAAGLIIMAFAFGPGILFLFLRRIKNLKPNPVDEIAMQRDKGSNKLNLKIIAGVATVVLAVCLVVGLLALKREESKPCRKVTQIKTQTQIAETKEEIPIGQLFPELEFKSLKGNTINVGQLKGKVVLINFWATWCGPCVHEVSTLTSVYGKYHDKGLEIIGISLDRDRNKLDSFLNEHNIAWPQYYDGKGWKNEISSRFDIHSIPTTVLLDRKGIVHSFDPKSEQLEKVVASLFEDVNGHSK